MLLEIVAIIEELELDVAGASPLEVLPEVTGATEELELDFVVANPLE